MTVHGAGGRLHWMGWPGYIVYRTPNLGGSSARCWTDMLPDWVPVPDTKCCRWSIHRARLFHSASRTGERRYCSQGTCERLKRDDVIASPANYGGWSLVPATIADGATLEVYITLSGVASDHCRPTILPQLDPTWKLSNLSNCVNFDQFRLRPWVCDWSSQSC